MHANNREEIKEAYSGDIVALVGVKDVSTGETLCDPTKPIVLEKMDFSCCSRRDFGSGTMGVVLGVSGNRFGIILG